MPTEPAESIPLLSLTDQHHAIADDIEAGLKAVFEGGQFVLGPNVEAFEQEVATYLGVPHAISCASGTDALHLALRALGVGPGDEVITSPFTFFATVEAILHTGARPVFADIDPHTFNLDPASVEAVITPATRALLPVHLYGQPAAMQPLLKLAETHDLRVIEDCAQSFGARVGERFTGVFGDAGCFSFFPNKNLGAYGDGGLITTHSDQLANQLRQLRNHGSCQRHHHLSIGYNSRLDEIQAAVLRVKLKRVDGYNEARQHIAGQYRKALAPAADQVVCPEPAPGCTHVYHQYTVLVADRDRVHGRLQSQGIGCAVHYPMPLYRQPALTGLYPDLELPVAEQVSRQCLCLPIFPELQGHQVQRVAATLVESLAMNR